MGCASSKPDFIANNDGDEAAFKARFEEGDVLGEGEFGVVKLVKDTHSKDSAPLAMKALKKGFTFKENTLYTPLKPEVIQTECNCLRVLNGERFNLKLAALYESPSTIYIITEMCSGGEMLEYLSGTMKDGLRTEDVSRISYQLLSAVAHCAKHKIIHRDIKPENIMFKKDKPGAELRLIDFGCASKDEGVNNKTDGTEYHKTFAGTPFYISPEMFQKKYTNKTDVWSVGVTLYVLVAGYPADNLQKAFNILQSSKSNRKDLPGLPNDMPDSYYEMLEGLLAYRTKGRISAEEALGLEFVKFHKDLESDVKADRPSMRRKQSVLFVSMGKQHGAYLNYQKFERAVTTILATVPSREELDKLLKELDKYEPEPRGTPVSVIKEEQFANDMEGDDNTGKLKVIKVGELKELIFRLGLIDSCSTIKGLANSSDYDGYAYNVDSLREMARRGDKYNPGLGGAAHSKAAAASGGGAEPPSRPPLRNRMSLMVMKGSGRDVMGSYPPQKHRMSLRDLMGPPARFLQREASAN